MRKYSQQELKLVRAQIEHVDSDAAMMLKHYIDADLKRRHKAGRPATSGLSRREQNKLAQDRFRSKSK